jgi:hypothetical protein
MISECVHTASKLKNCLTAVEIEPATFALSSALPTELRHQVGSSG